MDVRVSSPGVECKSGTLTDFINPETKNSHLADLISRVKEQSKPRSLTVLGNNLIINSTVVIGNDYGSGSNSSYRDIVQSPVTPDSDQSEEQNTSLSEQHTGKEHFETIDGIQFITFESEYDLNEFTKVDELKDSEENITQSDDGLFLDDTLKPDQDTRQGIVLRKTRDITKVKGWRSKMFAANENCRPEKRRTVEFDDGFESSDIKVEPGTSSEKHNSLVNWFDEVSIQTGLGLYDTKKIIKEEKEDPVDVESISGMNDLMDWKESVVPEPLPKPPENVPNKNTFDNSAFYSDRLNEYMKHAQLSCGLPDTEEQEPHRDTIEYNVSSVSNDLPKVATPRIGPKAKTLAEKRRLMDEDRKTIDSIKHRRCLKNIARSKRMVSKTPIPQLSREEVIANLDPNYKYVWIEGRPIKIMGSKGPLNNRRKTPKPTPQPKTTVIGPLGKKIPTNSKLSTVSKPSKTSSEINATATSPPKPEPVPTNSKITKQTSPAPTPAVNFRSKLRPPKISIIPPTAANHSDFYDRLPITIPSFVSDESELFVYGIAIYPEINRPLEALPTMHLESLRNDQKELNDDWIKFATSVVTSIKSPVPPAKKTVLIVSQLQEPNKTRRLIPAKIPPLKCAIPVVNPQVEKIQVSLNESLLDSPTVHPGDIMSDQIQYSYDIASIAEDMLDYIELKEELALVPSKYDPDDDRIVDESSPAMKKMSIKKKGSALDHELRRLNVNVIDVDEVSEVSSKLAGVKCVQDFCCFGCVCISINTTNHAMINHCRQVNCIFQCVCSTQTTAEDFSTFSPTTVSKIQESTRHLAKVEKEFQQTVVRGNDEMFVVKCGNGRHKREIKLPERYRNGEVQLSMDFEMAETRMMSVNNTDTSVRSPAKTCTSVISEPPKKKTFVEFIPKHTAKRMLKNPLSIRKKKAHADLTRHYEKQGVIKPSHVLMFRAIGLEDVKTLCMDHLMYKCPCDIHPRRMNKVMTKPVPTHSSSPDHSEKMSSLIEPIYSASTIPEPTGDSGSDRHKLACKRRLSNPLGVKSRCVALKSTTPLSRQIRRQALAAARMFSSSPSVGSTKNLAASSNQVTPVSEASPYTLNVANQLAAVCQAKTSTSNQTNAALFEISKETQPNTAMALTQTSQRSSSTTASVLPPRVLDPQQSLLCHETLPAPEEILDNLTDSSDFTVINDSMKMRQETAPKQLPLPECESPTKKAMLNHSKRLHEVLVRRHEEIHKQISEGDRQLDLNSRVTGALQLVKWNMLRKRFEDYTLQVWVTTHNNLAFPKLLITERKNELPKAKCKNLRTWHRDRWDDLPPLAIDLITKTPQNVRNDLYGILYYDGTNWELCKQVKKRDVMSSKVNPKKAQMILESDNGFLQNEQPQFKYNLLLPKFRVPVRWYTIYFDIKFDFILLEKRIKVPYVHLTSMCDKSALCGNPCRYSELSTLPNRYVFKDQFGIYADPHHSEVVFLGPFRYMESCDVRMMMYTDMSPGSFFELKNNKPLYKHAWWYATGNFRGTETVTLKNLVPPRKCSKPLTTNQDETKVDEELTTMPIITSVRSLRNSPNSDWVSPSTTAQPDNVVPVPSTSAQPDNVVPVPSTSAQPDNVVPVPSTSGGTKYRSILPNNLIGSPLHPVPGVRILHTVDIDNTSQVANSGSKSGVKRNAVLSPRGVLAVRLEPSLPHVGHFQANIYGCQRYQITLPDNDSRVLKDLKAANIFLNEFIQKQVEFHPPDLSLSWQPVMTNIASSSLPFNKFILEKKHVITQTSIMTKELFTLQMKLNPPVMPVSPELSRQNSIPQELRRPVYRLMKMMGTKKDFWSNVMKEIDGVYQTSDILSEQKEHLTSVKKQLVIKFNELVKEIGPTHKRTCNETIANVRYILKHAPATNSSEINTPTVENASNTEDDDNVSMLVDIEDDDDINASISNSVGKEKNLEVTSRKGNHNPYFEYSSDEDGNDAETSNDDSNVVKSVADKLQQSPQCLSSENSSSSVENTALSVMEEVRRRKLKIPKGTDIALCDTTLNLTRMQPDVLTIQEEPNMTMISIDENASLVNTGLPPGISWTKLKPSTDVSTPRPVSVKQSCKDIELLDLTGEEVKVSSIRKKVQIETIELEDDDISVMEASELEIVEKMAKGASLVLNSNATESSNNIETRRDSVENNGQSGPRVANKEQTTVAPSRSAALTRQRIVPVVSGKTVSIRHLGNTSTFQYKKFSDLSSLKPGTNLSMGNLHVKKMGNLHMKNMTPFPPYKFLEVPAKPPLLLPKLSPTSMSLLVAGNRTSSSGKNIIVQSPMKLQSVLQPSLQPSASGTKNALCLKRPIVPKLPVGTVYNQLTHNMSHQHGVSSKTVSLMMKNGKVQVMQLPQLNSTPVKPTQMKLSKNAPVKFVPVMKSVLQSASTLDTSCAVVLPPAQVENEQTGLSKNESAALKPTSMKSFSPIWRSTNLSLSSEPPAKKLCVRNMANTGPSQLQSSLPVLLNAVPSPSPTKTVHATITVEKEVPKSLPYTVLPLNNSKKMIAATSAPINKSTTVNKLPIPQSKKVNANRGYFLKNQFKPVKPSNLNILGSTFSSTSSSGETLPVEPSVASVSSQEPTNIPHQPAGSEVLQESATISPIVPSTDVGQPSKSPEQDEDSCL